MRLPHVPRRKLLNMIPSLWLTTHWRFIRLTLHLLLADFRKLKYYCFEQEYSFSHMASTNLLTEFQRFYPSPIRTNIIIYIFQSRSIHVAFLSQPNPLHMVYRWITNSEYPHDTCAQPHPVPPRAYRPKRRTTSVQFTVDLSGSGYNTYEPIRTAQSFQPRGTTQPRNKSASE